MLLLLIYIHNIFTSQKVNAINAMPTTMLVVTYAMKPAIFPFCNIWKLSFANVEKVVNPPQNPTVRNNCHELPSFDVLLNNPNNNPIIRQPARLTNSVAHGKPLLMLFMATDIRYRAAPPTKLPQPIIIVFFIISEIISILLSQISEVNVYMPPTFSSRERSRAGACRYWQLQPLFLRCRRANSGYGGGDHADSSSFRRTHSSRR